MARLADLVNAMATALGNIPELVAVLAPVNPIQAYIDRSPTSNDAQRAVYEMQPGQLIVQWAGSYVVEGEYSRWAHMVNICTRSQLDQSDLDLVELILTGIPVPGDGLPWMYCPLLANLYPTVVMKIERDRSTDNIDFVVIQTETREVGGWPIS